MMDQKMLARQKSLQSLMDAMDEDDSKRIPKITIAIDDVGDDFQKGFEGEGIEEHEGDEPQGGDEDVPLHDDAEYNGLGYDTEPENMNHAAMGETISPFKELLMKKLKEKSGR